MRRAIDRELQRCRTELHAMLGPRGEALYDDEDDELAQHVSGISLQPADDTADITRALTRVRVDSVASRILDILTRFSRPGYAWRMRPSHHENHQTWEFVKEPECELCLARIAVHVDANLVVFSHAYYPPKDGLRQWQSVAIRDEASAHAALTSLETARRLRIQERARRMHYDPDTRRYQPYRGSHDL